MIKPNWNNSPEWACYLAQDESGGWYWFENEPSRNASGEWVCMYGDCDKAESNSEWAATLEKRP